MGWRQDDAAPARQVFQPVDRDRQPEQAADMVEGLAPGEIADVVGVAPGSVGTLIARAIKRFTAVYRPVEG